MSTRVQVAEAECLVFGEGNIQWVAQVVRRDFGGVEGTLGVELLYGSESFV